LEHLVNNRPRILTGDTPTGRLHLGHWVGSLENRVHLQEEYDCYFLLANMHAFTTLAERWEASWDNNLRLALLAEASGLECMVPVARWKGFGGATNVNANHTMKKPCSEARRFLTRSMNPNTGLWAELRRSGFKPEHRVIGQGEVGSEELGQELVIELHVDTDGIPGVLVARVLGGVRPAVPGRIRGVEGSGRREPRVLDAVGGTGREVSRFRVAIRQRRHPQPPQPYPS